MEFAKQAQICVLHSIIVTTFIAYQCNSTSIEGHHRLHQSLSLEKDSNLLRPSNDTRYGVEVGLRFAPVHLVLDEVKQELKIRGMLLLRWTDYRLQWDPRDFGEIHVTKMPLKKSGDFTVWTPELVLNESIETDFASLRPETFIARLDYTGDVTWYTFAVTRSLCRLNHLFYPFDRQTCFLTFTTWAYVTSEQWLYHIDDIISNKKYRDYLSNEGLWEPDIPDTPESFNVSYDCWDCEDEEQSFVRYTITLKRKQRILYFFSLIFPCLVLSVITCATPFVGKVTNADPAGFGLTCVLTLMVFLTFVFATLPSSSQPFISFCIAWFIFEALLLTLLTILDYNVASKTDDRHEENKVSPDRGEKADCGEREIPGINPSGNGKTGEKCTSDTALAVTGVTVTENRPENDPTSQGRTVDTTTPGTDSEIAGLGIEVEVRPDTDPTSQDRTDQATTPGTDPEIAGRSADPEIRPDTDPTSQVRTGHASTSAAKEGQGNKWCGRSCRDALYKCWKGKSCLLKTCCVVVVFKLLITAAFVIILACV